MKTIMKVCVAQTQPIKGDISKNIEKHIKLIKLAIKNKADVIVFPELSITGYEAALSKELATIKDDKRFDQLQKISEANQIVVGIGLPTKNEKGICISMLIFQPQKARECYSKEFLHPGEEKHFVPGENTLPIQFKGNKIGIAICYETSIAEHSERTFKNGANIYIASVLNSVGGVDKDINRISNTAKKHQAIALMSNFVGESGGYDCAGKSSIWNREGVLIEQLDNLSEGIAIVDINTNETVKVQL